MRAVELEGDAAVPVARLLLAFTRGFKADDTAAGKCRSANVDDEGFGDAPACGSGGGFNHEATQFCFDGGLGGLIRAECCGDFVVAFGGVEGKEEWCAADAGGLDSRWIAFEAEAPAGQVRSSCCHRSYAVRAFDVAAEDEVFMERCGLRKCGSRGRQEKRRNQYGGARFGQRTSPHGVVAGVFSRGAGHSCSGFWRARR